MAKIDNREKRGQLAGTPSQLFDAVAVILSKEGTEMMLKEGAALQWVSDAYGHLKAIGYNPEAKPLLDKAHVAPDDGIAELSKQFTTAAAKRYFDREPKVRSLA